MKTILILEDNEERISDFRKAANQLGKWLDAKSQIIRSRFYV